MSRLLPGRLSVAALALLAAASCRDGDTFRPPGQPRLAFGVAQLALDTTRTATLTVRNDGTVAVGPVTLVADAVRDESGAPVVGASVVLSPPQIATLNPGDARSVQVTVQVPQDAVPGAYAIRITATATEVQAEVGLTLRVAEPPSDDAVGVEILAAPPSVRQGDVVTLRAEARDADGVIVENPNLAWSVIPVGAGQITADGRFVGYAPGTARIVASSSEGADTAEVAITPRGLSGSFALTGHGLVAERYTSDLWLHGQHAYTGTWSIRPGTGPDSLRAGNTMYAWSIANPGAPALTDSVRVDARVVNDVKIRADGRLGVITHEASSDGLNGVTLLDLADPAHPRVIRRFTEGLASGIHNVWIDGNFVYVVLDGGSGMRVLDIANPQQPRVVGSYYAGSSFLHDVYVRNGLAFLSHWNAGLVILDVGNGIAGGSPSNPVEVSRIELGGQTHNAWYWPAGGYVFVGEEDYATPGIMHVVDVRELTRPREVATFGVPGDPPHNFWLDEAGEVLYMAWYSNGLRAVDVSGELLGDLTRQGREIAASLYGTPGGCPAGTDVSPTCTWAPQLHQGRVWVSDMNGGLFSLTPSF